MLEAIQNWPIVVQVLMYVAAFNLALSGLKAGLESIKDKTSNTVDNKVHDVVAKISNVLSKILDAIGYNPKH
jgi:formiminotetrahydrofolate cyclodeaminase